MLLCSFLETKNIQRGLSLEEELFNEEVIRLNSKSPENFDPGIENSNLEFNGQTSLINESFEASLASSTCGEDSEEESENNQDDRLHIDFNKEDSIHDTVRNPLLPCVILATLISVKRDRVRLHFTIYILVNIRYLSFHLNYYV